ncbi:hypothetical protein A9Q99_24860 [Gammaproteobacteria bacterium 45_16_T64]|nr:hypothetical protein A9Q99_24860 [Gammaproteobacteria bacterium 45_16_T64]
MKKWNRNDQWEIRKTFHEVSRLSVLVGSQGNRAKALSVVRKFIPRLRTLSPKEIVEKIDSSGFIDIGKLPGREVRDLCRKLSEEEIPFQVENASYVTYLPLNQSNNTVWLIEDLEESRLIAEEMIEEGIKVIEVQA